MAAASRARDADGMTQFGDTVDPEDIDRFAAHSAGWWDPEGSFRPLHRINPARIDFIGRLPIEHYFSGYGEVDISRCLGANEQRATLLGWGSISDGAGHIFELPLPPSQ